MKNKGFILKWLYKKTKPFLPQIFMIIIVGSISSLCSVAMALASKKLIDYAVARQTTLALQQGLVFGGIILLLLAMNAVSSMLSVRVTEAMSNRFRLDMYQKLSLADWESFSKYHSEDVLTRMTSDVSVVVNGITSTVPAIISLVVQMVTAFITLFSIDKILGILSFVLGPVTLLFYSLLKKKLRSLHIEIQEKEGQYRAIAHESIQNMLVVKTFSMEKKTRDQMQKIQKERLASVLKRNGIGVMASSSLSLGYWVGYFMAFAWGAMKLAQNKATFGSLTAFLQLVGQVQTPFFSLARSVPQLIATEASASRIAELETLKPENFEELQPLTARMGIKFDHVSFSFSPEKVILSDLNFTIKPGEIVGLVGPSGEGKTTIIRLLLSLLNVQEGTISLITNDSEEMIVNSSCRTLMAYVPQGNTLFSGTIADNLLFANPEATYADMVEALHQADAWDYIQELPDGINTKIGEKALRLSEGQAQRIAIARAFIKKAPIMLFDEATSALDTKTELHVLQSIKNQRTTRTCIIVTHRPSALNICHRVFHLKEGTLEERKLSEVI